jgi:hypothetical protein
MTKYTILATLAVAAAIATNAPAAKAEPTVSVAVSAPLTPVTLGAAAVFAVLANKAFAKKPFGENGEIMKALAVPVKISDGNVKASGRESGEIAKILRASAAIVNRSFLTQLDRWRRDFGATQQRRGALAWPV